MLWNTPVKDKRGEHRRRQKALSDHDAGLTPMKGKKMEGKSLSPHYTPLVPLPGHSWAKYSPAKVWPRREHSVESKAVAAGGCQSPTLPIACGLEGRSEQCTSMATTDMGCVFGVVTPVNVLSETLVKNQIPF